MPKQQSRIPRGAKVYAEFHKKLEKIIEENWGVIPQFSDPFAWGYSSTGIYIKDIEGKEYVAILADNTPEKAKAMAKNIAIANGLNLSVETPKQLQTKDGKYLLNIGKIDIKNGKNVENKIMSLGYFLSGILPFDMNLDIVLQAVGVLHEMHQINPEIINYPLEKIDCDAPKFLHGDLTPSNMLIAYGKIMGVIDFELSILGPVEYDLARLAVFSWFRMGDTPFLGVLQKVKEKYPEDTSLELLEKFSLLHCQMHLDNIKKHEKGYIDEKTYQEELIFTEGRLKVLMADLVQNANPIL